ncbi:ATP-binding protein [Candidatus Poribacteria bacterium]|nr:ATP-binding protein [Candidatus Poribacteria bacterium]
MVSFVWNRIRELYEAEVAHHFLLHLNTRDIVAHNVFGYIPFSDYLLWNVGQLGDESVNWLLMAYDRSLGAVFPPDLRVRGGERADYQWRFGLNATLYKFAQSSSVAGNDRAALGALAALSLLDVEFGKCAQDDSADEKPFARMRDDPTFQAILATQPRYQWKHLNSGIRAARSGVDRNMALGDVINRFDGLLHGNPYGRRVAILIERVEMMAPNRHRSRRNEPIGNTESILLTETLARWSYDKVIRARRNLLVMTTQNLADVAPEILDSRELVVLEVPLPELQERRAFLRHLGLFTEHWQPPPEPKEGEEPVKDWPPFRQRTQYPDRLRYSEGFNQRDAAQQTAGLTLSSIYDAILPSTIHSTAVRWEDLHERKAREVLDFSRGLLELVPPDTPLEHVGGLTHVGRYFQEVITRLLASDRVAVPNGVWLFGPPGTGKSMTLHALARSTIVPVLRLRMPHELGIRPAELGLAAEDAYANDLMLALNYARSIGPSVVFIDRVDETFRRGSTALGRAPTSRATGMLLDWMSRPDTRCQILWVGASSAPELVEPSLVAVPLMDTLVYLLPTPQERADILRKVLLHTHVPFSGDIPFEELMRQPAAERLTGEDLATIVVRASRRASVSGRSQVVRDDLLATLNDFASESTPMETEWRSLQAARFSTARTQLPDVILPPLAASILDGSRVAKERIDARLRELSHLMSPTGV